MRVITVNVNGVRAAARKGFFEWLLAQNPDVVCLQETKAQLHQLEDPVFSPVGYHCYYFDAIKKGYSGVALYCKTKPDKVIKGLGWEIADTEGRYIQADFSGVSVASLYLPSGTSGDVRQNVKYDFLERFEPLLQKMRKRKREFVICGDWNIAHKEIDLKNWRANQTSSGFLPDERAFMDRVFGKLGFVDSFRVLNQEEEQYTWWSHRGQAWANNTGWRIDYQVVTPGLEKTIQSVNIYTAERFSDHAPVTVDYKL